MTITQEQIAALVKRLRERWDWSNSDDKINDMIDQRTEAAEMLEQLAAERNTCPLGDDCDLTVAWMVGYSKGFEEARQSADRKPKGKADE